MDEILNDNSHLNISRTKSSRLAGTVAGLSAISVCSKVFGFSEKLIIAHVFGTSDNADIYFLTTGILLSVVYFVKELVYPSVLPIFVQSLSQSHGSSSCLFRKIFIYAGLILIITAAFFGVFSKYIIYVFAPGFSQLKQHTSTYLLRLLTPAVLFLSMTTITNTILNARKQFLTAAWPETAYKLFVVTGLLILLPVAGIYALAAVLGSGALCYLAIHLMLIPEHKHLLSRGNNDGSDNGRKILSLMKPLMIGVVFSHISGIVDNILASTLPAGHLSYLGYSKKLVDAILLIGPTAFVTVIYSYLSHLASNNDMIKFRATVHRSIRLLLYLSLPICCLMLGLKEPIIRTLFQRGHFGSESTAGTSNAFMIYSLGYITFSLEILLVYSFFALSDTKTPVKCGIICVFLDILLAILFIEPYGYSGIAGALVISKTIKVIILFFVLSKRLVGLFDPGMKIFLLKLIPVVTGSLFSLYIPLPVNSNGSLLHTLVFEMTIPAFSATAVYMTCSCLFKIEEFKMIISILRKKGELSFIFRGEQT